MAEAAPDRDEPDRNPAGEPERPSGVADAIQREPSRLRRWLLILGPGLITGASNNDPSAIATYAKIGASLGLALLWAPVVLFPMMATAVYLAAALAMVSCKGLGGILRTHYPRWVIYPTVAGLVIANTFNAGADIGAIAAGIKLVVPIATAPLVVVVAAGLLVFEIWGSYRLINRILKWLTLALFAFLAASLMARPDWREVLMRTVAPRLRPDTATISSLVAMIGTALSPYLFFWHSSQRVEEEMCLGRRRVWQRRSASDTELKYAAWDVNTGMAVCSIVIYSIILATATTLFRTGHREVETAADAARALAPIAGRAASVLFAVGFIAAGLLAVPVLTAGAAYAVAEASNWKFGLDLPFRSASRFYTVMAASLLAGTAVNFVGLSPITLLFWAAITNGLLTPVVLVVIMLASGNRRIMGERVSGRAVKVVGWLTAAATIVAAGMLVYAWVA